MKEALKIALAVVVVFMLLGFAGRYDWSEQVVYTMPQEAYEAIVLKIGDGCSNYDIAREYTDNKAYYDALSNF